MANPAVTLDSEGFVKAWSAKAEELFGYSVGQAIGSSLGDLIVPEAYRPYHEMGLRRYVATREPHCVGYVVDIEAIHQQGHSLELQMKIVPRDEGDELFLDAHFGDFE